MSQRLKILFLSSWYPSFKHSTLGNFVQRHAEAVSTLHDVHVLYLASFNEVDTLEVHDSMQGQVQTTIVYYNNSSLSIIDRFSALKKGIHYIEQTSNFNFDLVHMNVAWPDGWQAVYIKRKYKIPFILTEHWTGYDLAERKHPGLKVSLISKLTAKHASIISPVTQNLAMAMQNFGMKGRYEVVPNVVDTSIFHLSEKSDLPIRFIHISSLQQEHKNTSGILNAWKEAVKKSASIHLTIGGDGPWEELRDESISLGIDPTTIDFFGELPWTEIARLMQESHCLVLFSNYENLPCVIVEALASGLAVISTNVGGISEHINKERGILVAKRNESELSMAFLKFATSYKKYHPVLLRKYAEDHFSIPSIARSFHEKYLKILSKNK